MLPADAGYKRSHGTAKKINGHIQRVYTVDGFGVERYHTGLISQMNALHPRINQENGNDDACVAVAATPCRQPSHQHNDSAYERKTSIRKIPMPL